MKINIEVIIVEDLIFALSIGLSRVFIVIILVGTMVMSCLNVMRYLTFNNEDIDGEVKKKIKVGFLRDAFFYFLGFVACWVLFLRVLGQLS